MYRLVITTIVTLLPLSYLRTEEDVQSKFGKASLNISGSSSIVASKDIPPASLSINQQFFLPKLDNSIPYGSIAMRVVLHGIPYDIGYFVIATVLQLIHGVHDTALYRLKAILQGGDSTFKDYIGGIVEKPILVHPTDTGNGLLRFPLWGLWWYRVFFHKIR